MPRIPFGPDNPGNVAGRPKGSPNKATKLRAAILDVVPEIIEAMKREAIGGDAAAARLLLERAIPVLKAVHPPTPLPVAPDTPPEDVAEAVYQGALSGEIDPDFAGSILALIGVKRNLDNAIADDQATAALIEMRAALLADTREDGPGE